MKPCFLPAEILLPRVADMTAWAVVACDQFTSQPEYWDAVRARVGDRPSALHMILPEAELNAPDVGEKIERANRAMDKALADGVFTAYPDALLYVERTLSGGRVRRGLIGKVDLEAYDYTPGAQTPIRATEGTVQDRIPPRMRVRRGAALELPHILMLADDTENLLLGPIAAKKHELKKLYDFPLMQDGGAIAGWLLEGADCAAFLEREEAFAASRSYPGIPGVPMTFAIGDGNHSLATAKAIWEERKAAGADPETDPARYALVELENIHDAALEFEPIHRIVTHIDPDALLRELREAAGAAQGMRVAWFAGEREGEICLDPACGELAVGILQQFLDGYLARCPEAEIDYIHGAEVLRELAKQPDAIGFCLPPFEKSQLFRGVMADGVLPRKTFSMGSACEKRYYLEGRKIR